MLGAAVLCLAAAYIMLFGIHTPSQGTPFPLTPTPDDGQTLSLEPARGRSNHERDETLTFYGRLFSFYLGIPCPAGKMMAFPVQMG